MVSKLDVFASGGNTFFFGQRDGSSKLYGQSASGPFQKIQAGRSRSRFKVGIGMPTELKNLRITVNDYSSRSVLLQDEAIGVLVAVESNSGLGSFSGPWGNGHLSRVAGCREVVMKPGGGCLLGKGLVLLVDWGKQVGECSDTLGTAQDQKP